MCSTDVLASSMIFISRKEMNKSSPLHHDNVRKSLSPNIHTTPVFLRSFDHSCCLWHSFWYCCQLYAWSDSLCPLLEHQHGTGLWLCLLILWFVYVLESSAVSLSWSDLILHTCNIQSFLLCNLFQPTSIQALGPRRITFFGGQTFHLVLALGELSPAFLIALRRSGAGAEHLKRDYEIHKIT